jgi:hypothetical protein
LEETDAGENRHCPSSKEFTETIFVSLRQMMRSAGIAVNTISQFAAFKCAGRNNKSGTPSDRATASARSATRGATRATKIVLDRMASCDKIAVPYLRATTMVWNIFGTNLLRRP